MTLIRTFLRQKIVIFGLYMLILNVFILCDSIHIHTIHNGIQL